MADLIQIHSNDPDYIYVIRTDQYGGVQYSVGLSSEMKELLRWIKAHKENLEKEHQARVENESVKAAYEQYQTVLKLVLDIV